MTLRTLIVGVVAVTILMLGSACAGSSNGGNTTDKTDSTVEPVSVGSTKRVHRIGEESLYVASQPGMGDFDEIQSRGIKTVINLRRPEETPEMNEEKTVTGLGMTYVNPGFSSPDALSTEIFDTVREQLRSAERPLFLHCSSANRASATWLPYRVLDQDVSLDQAVKEAETMGLRSPALKKKALEYIKARQSGTR